jgi:ABC-type lipoprotein export system ATPase subunit
LGDLRYRGSLADEPTGNLDSKTGTEIMALFENLSNNGPAIIVVTNDWCLFGEHLCVANLWLTN